MSVVGWALVRLEMEKRMGWCGVFPGVGGLLFVVAFVAMSIGGVGESEACRPRMGYTAFDRSDFVRDNEGDGQKVDKPMSKPPKGKPVFPKTKMLELVSANPIAIPKPGRWNTCSRRGYIVFKAAGHKDYGLKLEIVEGNGSGRIPPFPIQPIDGELFFSRGADINKPQPAINFKIRARWVDRWGRESAASKPIQIHIPAVDEVYDSVRPKPDVQTDRPSNWVELR